MSARYLTSTLPYVNADPHIGFALEIVQTDALARAWRAEGHEVFFSTGTDEHGQKILEAAEKSGKDVQEYVDHYAAEFQKLREALDLSNDTFIRTTDARHVAAAQEMWKRCEASGDIYKKAYEGLYCVGCEKFLTERDMEGGKCVIHQKEPVLLKEENYFFRFSKYQDALLEYLSRSTSVVPEWRREEALNFVKGGLGDFSISREKERLSWGIPVPGDDTQVLYVWFDALTNYISTLGWPEQGGNFEKFWTNGFVLQTAGKDQVRFQSLMWQAMLISAGVKATDTVFYHGFITSGGQKMSKSLGNVISPYDLVTKYGTDATRYLLLRHVHPFEDSDVTWERLDEWYTANLVNGLGNLVARVMKLAEEHLPAPVAISEDEVRIEAPFVAALDAFRFDEAVDLIFSHIQKGDEYITEKEPYKKVKVEETKEEAKKDLEKLVIHLAKVAAHLAPLMPSTARAIQAAIATNTKPENLFPRLP
ncbi:MAG: methionine--tRNA ligase [Patescibacteria group bacterium]